jgi:GTPase SAR1 family protein
MHLSDNDDVLDLVDGLRSQGISHYIDLPQIVVCGDQSSGKSSVLEAISGLQFPRKDNLCTRFATEVILRRSITENTNASIVPANDRQEDERKKLSTFRKSDFQLDSLESLVEEARDAMGIDGEARSFSNDVLRIELSGPEQPHLTLVDLPGLFSAGNKAQSESDADAVKALVLSYMRNPRSIILAVVSAKNDFANQIVTKYTRDVDVDGTRTLGIITKPDTLDAGSESERSYLVLAKNEDVYFRLGWHVLRNRDFDTRTVSADQRDEIERNFFATGVWTELIRSHVGISALRPRLSHLLRQQILAELPSLIADVQEGLDGCKSTLSHMGTARATTEEQRLYLLRISQDFTFLIRSAKDGSYLDGFFGDAASRDGYSKRLRAVIQNNSLNFAKSMRESGHAKHIVDTVTENQSRMNPRLISKDEYVGKILSLMSRSRGRELPGTYNPHIIGDLFREQSEPWQGLVHSFVIEVWDATQATLRLILNHVADANTAASLQRKVLQPALNNLKDSLDEAVGMVLEQIVNGHPITYNHYLTDNIQKLRGERQTAVLSHKLDQFFGTKAAQGQTYCANKSFDVKSLLQILTQSTVADMDRYACSEAADVMKAYYKASIQTSLERIMFPDINRWH